MICFDEVCITLDPKHVIADSLSLVVSPREKIAIVGESGVGKSTILRAMVGLVPVESGQMYIDSTPVQPDTVQDIRRKVAFLEQEPILGAELCKESLLLPFQFKSHRKHLPDNDRIQDVLAQVGLPAAILEKSTKVVSGGEKQRLVLARALLLNNRIILADEPTSGLAAEQRASIVDLLTSMPGLTLLAVTHQPEEWQGRVNRILKLQSGQLAVDTLHSGRHSTEIE